MFPEQAMKLGLEICPCCGKPKRPRQIVALTGANLCVASPPYSGNEKSDYLLSSDGKTRRRDMKRGFKQGSGCFRGSETYGQTVGNLGNMKPGDFAKTVIISSAQTENVSNGFCMIYVLFLDSNNGIAAIAEIRVLSDILRLLRSAGVPVFSINFNNHVAVGKIEVTVIPPDFELPDVSDVCAVKQKGELHFQLALPAKAVAPQGTIDSASVIEAMWLNKKSPMTNRTLFFNLRSSEQGKAFLGAEFDSAFQARLQNGELMSALLTGNFGDRLASAGESAGGTTIGLPLFGVYGRNSECLSTLRTKQKFLAPALISMSTLQGAAFVESSSDLIGRSVKSLSTIQASAIGANLSPLLSLTLASLKKKVAGRRTEKILVASDIFCEPVEVFSALTASQVDATSHMVAPNSPSIITPQYKESVKQKEPNFVLAVSSPPFQEAQNGGGLAKPEAVYAKDGHHFGKYHGYQGQGSSSSQLSAMKPGEAPVLSVSSPPYEGSMNSPAKCGIDWKKANRPDRVNPSVKRLSPQVDGGMAYSSDAKNLGNSTGPTFWACAREILLQLHQVLAPGGHAIWVCADFVRKGKRVPFSDQWAALCEATGFKVVCRHQAMKVEEGSAQQLIGGGEHRKKTLRKSFFRRLGENQAQAAVWWGKCAVDVQRLGLRDAEVHLTKEYEEDTAEYERTGEDEYKPTPVTPARILRSAQMAVWKAAGSPEQPIETCIEWENVICCVRE